MTATFTSPTVDIIIPSKVNTAFTQLKTDIETLQAGGGVFTTFVAAGATKVLTAAHNNNVILLDDLAGSEVTLPDATGSGVRFRFYVSAAPTSSAHKISVASSADTMIGLLFNENTTGNATTGFAAQATSDTITMNGTTQGSKVAGDCIDLVDIADTVWAVSGWLTTSGTSATPFSAAV